MWGIKQPGVVVNLRGALSDATRDGCQVPGGGHCQRHPGTAVGAPLTMPPPGIDSRPGVPLAMPPP